MAGRIPQTFIDDLLNRIDIVDVIEKDVTLKKSGKDHQGLCPFHNEKTPSFTVSQEKQFYHCFGCGAHGSAIGFLMNHRGLSFVEAIEEAAHMVGLEVPREQGESEPRVDYAPLFAITERAQQYFADQLRHHATRDRAVDYLKGRGLTGQVAKTFGIGYAPESWNALMDILTGDGFAADAQLEAGMITENDNGKRYDRFRDRITFPIYDKRGRVVAFGGRVIDQGEPKYLNSPESPIFQKRRELYGLYQLRQAHRNPDQILVVEGYMDVVALAQFGVTNAVASLGTSTTVEQLELMFKTAPEILFCYDGDNAGRRAAWRAVETVLPLIRDGRQAGFVFMPQGHDPDSYVREYGAEAFKGREIVKPLSEFLFEEQAAQVDMQSLDGRARFVEITRPLVKKVPRGSFRQLLIQRVAEMARLDTSTLVDGPSRPVASQRRRRPRHSPHSMVDRALKRVLFDPSLARTVSDVESLGTLPDPNASLLCQILELCIADPNITTGTLVEKFRDTEHDSVLAAYLDTPLDLAPEAEALEFRQAIDALREKSRRTSALERAEEELKRRSGGAE